MKVKKEVKKVKKISNKKKKVQKQVKPVIERKEAEKKVLQTKLNRVIGQLGGIKKMIEDGRVSEDLLMQLCAAESGLESLKFMLYKEIALSDFSYDKDNQNIDEYIDKILTTIRRY